jgi:hypothetical protein
LYQSLSNFTLGHRVMVGDERARLLGERWGRKDAPFLPSHKKRNESRISIIESWKTLVSLLAASTLYGIYSIQTWQRPNTSDRPPSSATDYTCIPGQACRPSSCSWNSFNQSISGNLRTTIPCAAPCYSNSSSTESQVVAKSYMISDVRSFQYSAMEFLDWETCGQSQCFLNSLQPSLPVSGECSLGRLSTYHVEAHAPEDISKTLDFVRKHDIRVSIKYTGHDYFGRSGAAANSLAIWTHNMKDLKFHKTFSPKGCKTRYENIGEIGAGIQA